MQTCIYEGLPKSVKILMFLTLLVLLRLWEKDISLCFPVQGNSVFDYDTLQYLSGCIKDK